MGQRPQVRRGHRGRVSKHRAFRIGVITDTHGLYDPAIERHFAGVKEILHGGDIGGEHVIQRLRQLAPVTAVSGNVDDFEASGFPRRLVLRRAGVTIAVCHILYEKGRMSPDAAAWLDREQADVCVFGHSHRPMIARHGRTLLMNPGSAGPRRFSLPRGIGLLTVTAGKPSATLIRLDDRIVTGAPVCHRLNQAKGARK